MIPVLGIPYYNRRELLSRCLASIDYPVAQIVIVDNSPDELDSGIMMDVADKAGDPDSVQIDILRHRNAGVAGSWNEIIKLFPANWWMLVNNDIEFAPGDLERMERYADGQGGPLQDGCYYANHGASFWIVTAYGIRTVGLFDENFYPAYLEDCDWSHRADLLGVKRTNVPGCSSVHGDETMPGSCTVNASPELQRECSRTHQQNFAYYEAKWGGKNEQEQFKTPFNVPHWPLQHWEFSPAMRRRQQWNLEPS